MVYNIFMDTSNVNIKDIAQGTSTRQYYTTARNKLPRQPRRSTGFKRRQQDLLRAKIYETKKETKLNENNRQHPPLQAVRHVR